MKWLSENWLWALGGLFMIFFIYRFSRPGRSQDSNKRLSRKKVATTSNVIDEYFSRYGGKYRRDSPDLWLMNWQSKALSATMFVKLAKHWIYFTISPFVSRPKDTTCKWNLYNHLLRLNRDITMAKFCVDKDGNVSLTVELPNANLDYEEFEDAIKSLIFITENTFEEIYNLSNYSNTVSRYA